MKKYSCGALLALLLAILCSSGCQKQEAVAPVLSAKQTRQAVLGKWRIEKIDYQLCRQGNCNINNYKGTPQDFFEFRGDSAFLVYDAAASYQPNNNYKADYTLPGAFILSHKFWSARYIVKYCQDGKMTLECSYTGSDPYAIFTDTYYLYR